MAGTWRISLGMFALFLFMAPSAGAFGVPQVSYYWAPPVYYYYHACPTTPLVVPVPDAPKKKDAKAAPPKSAGDARPPIIIATRAPAPVSPGKAPMASLERCRVGFWNLTGRDVTLTVDGKSWTLAMNRSMTLDLAHQFTWHIDVESQHTERLPETLAMHEVVIR